jgi:hypothetical protein
MCPSCCNKLYCTRHRKGAIPWAFHAFSHACLSSTPMALTLDLMAANSISCTRTVTCRWCYQPAKHVLPGCLDYVGTAVELRPWPNAAAPPSRWCRTLPWTSHRPWTHRRAAMHLGRWAAKQSFLPGDGVASCRCVVEMELVGCLDAGSRGPSFHVMELLACCPCVAEMI